MIELRIIFANNGTPEEYLEKMRKIFKWIRDLLVSCVVNTFTRVDINKIKYITVSNVCKYIYNLLVHIFKQPTLRI